MQRGSGDNMDISQDEVSMLGKAMRKKKFRGLMQEYVDEISDPAHRKEYDEYLEELEAKREMPDGVELLRAEPGMCVLTHVRFGTGQKQKLYLNICHTPHLGEVGMQRDASGDGQRVNLPYTLSPPRPDRDLDEATNVLTCDFAVHTTTLARVAPPSGNPQMLKVLVDTACQAIEQSYLKSKEEVLKDFKVLDIPCKGGTPYPMSVPIGTVKRDASTVAKQPKGKAVTPAELRQLKKDARAKMGQGTEAIEEADEDEEEEVVKPEEAPTRIRVPQHRLLHVHDLDLGNFLEQPCEDNVNRRQVPRQLKLVVNLPTVKKVSEVDLDVAATNVVLEVADKFYLDVSLPYEIDAGKATAKFDKHKSPSELTLVLPVVPGQDNPLQVRADAAPTEGRELDEDPDEELPDLEEPPAEEVEEKEEDEKVEEEEAKEAPEQHSPEAVPEAPRSQALSDAALGAAPSDGFDPSPTFTGSRPGWYFSTGDQGTGYYIDNGSTTELAPRAKPKPALPPEPVFEPLLSVVNEKRTTRRARQKQVLEEGAAAIPCGEPFVVCERENMSRAFVVLRAPGTTPREPSVLARVKRQELRVVFLADREEETCVFEFRRVLAQDCDARQLHWEWCGAELVVCVTKDAKGWWGDPIFRPIGADFADDSDSERGDDDDAVETLPDGTEHAVVPSNAVEESLPDVDDERAGQDALLGMAVPLSSRLFLELY